MNKWVARAVINCLQDPRYQVTYQDPVHRPYENNLNHCVAEVLEHGYDYWLTMDDDNPPIRNPLDMVRHDLDIVGFPTPVWHSEVRGDRPWYFNALDFVNSADGGGWKPAELTGGLQEVDAIGSGCMLIAYRVLKLMDKPLFMREYDEMGRVVRGHDYLFSQKAKAAGFKIWVDGDYPCRHFVGVELLEVIESFDAFHSGGRMNGV